MKSNSKGKSPASRTSSASKKNKKKVTTELGTFRYPHLARPDTRFGEEKFKVGLIPLRAEYLDDFEAAVVELAEETYNKKQLASYTSPIKTDKKDGTRYIEAHTYEIPMVADAKGKPVKNPEDLRIGGGTVGRLKITLSADPAANKPYVTAYLNGVQVVKLVEYGAGGFSDVSDEVDDDDAFDAASVPASERRSSRDDDDEAEDNDDEEDGDEDGRQKSATDF